MLDRHSLFWKLTILLVGFCLLMIGLSYTWGRHMETQNAFLSEPARQTLRGYAAEAEQAWRSGGAAGGKGGRVTGTFNVRNSKN